MLSDLGNGIGEALRGYFERQGDDAAELNAAVKKICNALLSSNVPVRIVAGLRKRVLERYGANKNTKIKKDRVLQKIVYEELCRIVDPQTDSFRPPRDACSVVVFVGLQGSGKTTTCCKYANYYRKRGHRVGIVCADTFRAGAYDQVKQNVKNVPVSVYIDESTVDPVAVAEKGVENLRSSGHSLILVDTSGRHTQEGELFKEMEDIIQATRPDATVFIVDASIGQAAEMHARGFISRVKLGSVIITKTDGAKNIGGALSSIAEIQAPVAFIGTGEGLNSIEPFSPTGFIGKLMGLGDLSGFADKLEGLDISEEGREELLGKIKSGEFCIGDFYEQYKKILELGPISQLLSLIPGLSTELLDEKAFRKMGTIFGSMTRKELGTNGEVFIRCPSRVIRVASGAGVPPKEVRHAISSYKMMSQMLTKISSNPLFSSVFGGLHKDEEGKGALPPHLAASPAEMKAQMQQLKKMMPPGMSSLFDHFDQLM